MTRGQHGTTWDCWRHEYYSSLSITLSLLSLDRDNTDKKDHGVTCVAAGLEEEPDSQGKMQNHRGQQESCDHVLETFESRWSTWIQSLQETPRNPVWQLRRLRRPHGRLPTYSTCYRLRIILYIRPERERDPSRLISNMIPRTTPIPGEQTFFSLNEFDPRLLSRHTTARLLRLIQAQA